MRMWMVSPRLLCGRHLGGEHVECHMFLGTLKRNISVKGYLDKKLLEIHNLQSRHDELAEEMLRRGGRHQSPLVFEWDQGEVGKVDVAENLEELKRRCPECRKRIEEQYA